MSLEPHSDATGRQPRIENHLARYADFRNHAFVALNTAFLEGVNLVDMSPAAVSKSRSKFIVSTRTSTGVSHPRESDRGRRRRARFHRRNLHRARACYFTNAVTEIVCGDERRGRSLQAAARIARGVSRFDHSGRSRRATACSPRTRSRSAERWCATTSTRCSKGTECTLNGLYIADGTRSTSIITPPSITPSRTAPATSCTRAFSTATRARSSTEKSSSAKTRRRPTPSRPTRTWCSPKTRSSTPSRNWKFSPTTSAARMAPPSASSMPNRFFTCNRAASAEADARSMLIYAFARDIIDRIKIDSLRDRAHETSEGRNSMTTATAFDVAAIREDFPVLNQQVHGHPLVYLDNAATARNRKPSSTPSAASTPSDYANIHRGVHELSERSTRHYEEARVKIQRFLNAARLARNHLRPRHHRRHQPGGADLRPQKYQAPATKSSSRRWSIIRTSCPGRCCARRSGAHLRSRADRRQRRSAHARIRALLNAAHAAGRRRARFERARHHPPDARRLPRWRMPPARRLLVDGAQAVPHMKVDVQDLDADFYAFSGHKIFGPTGIGVLYGKTALLECHAALSGRRRHDPLRSPSRRPPTTRCRTSSKPARRISPA